MGLLRVERVAGQVEALGPGARIVVLVGPGVISPRGLEGLRRLAERGGLGVLNTWGAKGVFPWDDPHHLGTVGLQERDFELAGLGGADLIIASGLNRHESPDDAWQLAPSVEVPPLLLDKLADAWPLAAAEPDAPPLYGALAEVVQPLFESDAVPLSPARAVAETKGALAAGGRVVADPGLAGFWVARTFPTETPDTVHVPSVGEPGYAAWSTLRDARAGRPSIAVTTGPYDLDTDEALAYAAASGVPLVVVAWSRDGESFSPGEYRTRLEEAVGSGRVQVIDAAVDWSHTDLLVEVAGPIVAWES